MVAAHCHAGADCNRWTIVVDDDIDPTNFNEAISAMCTRCDPRDQYLPTSSMAAGARLSI